jgi:uncharacterized protein
MLDFQRYQLEFTAHIREPAKHKKPAGVVPERMAVYREAVFNNIFESVSVCFPVCQTVLAKQAWRALIRGFVVNYQAQTPIFREIPPQFLRYLDTQKQVAAYIKQLAHYEWVELAVGALETKPVDLSKTTDLLNEKPILTSAHMLLEYDYPVHKISARRKPKTTEKTYLLVFRNAAFDVKFIELNPVTFQLLKLINENNMTGKQALMRLAEDLQHPDANAVIQFGVGILQDLASQQAIIGSKA